MKSNNIEIIKLVCLCALAPAVFPLITQGLYKLATGELSSLAFNIGYIFAFIIMAVSLFICLSKKLVLPAKPLDIGIICGKYNFFAAKLLEGANINNFIIRSVVMRDDQEGETRITISAMDGVSVIEKGSGYESIIDIIQELSKHQ